MHAHTMTSDRPFRRRLAVFAVVSALLAASVSATLVPPARADGPAPIVDVTFGGDFVNKSPRQGGTVVPFQNCQDPNIVLQDPCNLSSAFDTDEDLGTFWRWTSIRNPGGGLRLTTTTNEVIGSSEEYTLGIRFAFEWGPTEAGKYLKVVDYSGYRIPEGGTSQEQQYDAGFYLLGGRVVALGMTGTTVLSEALVTSGQVVDLIVVRTIEMPGDCDKNETGVEEAGCLTAYLVTEEAGVVRFLRGVDRLDRATPATIDGASRFGLFHDDRGTNGNGGGQYAPAGRVHVMRLWDRGLARSEVRTALGPSITELEDESDDDTQDTQEQGGGEVGSGPMLIGGVLPSLPRGGAELVRPDGTVVTATVTPSGGGILRYEFDGITLDLTGGPQTTTSGGLVVGASGEIALEISAPLVVGGVIEAWMFSEPRLVGAVRVGDQPSQRFVIPVGAPLDGRGPVPAGPHTLQLQLPTAAGMQAVHVGLTVGGPVPTGVPAGESPGVPAGPLAVAVGLALVAGMVVRRRAVDLVG
jgi:hypothetical protein